MILRGTAYIKGELKRRYIEIDDGRIVSVSDSKPSDKVTIEWDGVILPAGIDMHVHFRDPGMTHKEDFFTGTRSAAFGGISTVLDMPNNEPPTDTVSRFKDKLKLADRKACIDFGLYALAGRDHKGLRELTDRFKVFLAPSTDVEAHYGVDDIKHILENKASVAFHCEDQKLFGAPGDDLSGHNENRPKESELSAIKSLAELPGKKHVCHVTTSEALKLARELSCTTEVTPHHLFLSQEALLGTHGKVNPPLRGDNEQLYLWEALERGDIDVIASDHAPHLESEKNVDFKDAPSGIPGVETMYPLLLNSVALGKLSLDTLVKAIAERPGELLGVKKGRIEEGYHADLILTDFRDYENISVERLHSKSGWSPFEGFRAIFPRHVISRGEFVIKEKEFVGKKGHGEYIR